MSSNPNEWKRTSPTAPGFHTVAVPGESPFRSTHLYRLNLDTGQQHTLVMPGIELVAAVISGTVQLQHEARDITLTKGDVFYMPGGQKAMITAVETAVLYVGGAVCEGIGAFHVRHLDLSLPIGEIHQIHGTTPYEREVFMSLDPATPASRLIAGFTWGSPGGWTSWPPHQHEADLEETYWYFDIPADKTAFHICYTMAQSISEAVAHPVGSGDCGLVPAGYHPTVAPPGVRSIYFWILVAHSHASRSYELAVPDSRHVTDTHH